MSLASHKRTQAGHLTKLLAICGEVIQVIMHPHHPYIESLLINSLISQILYIIEADIAVSHAKCWHAMTCKTLQFCAGFEAHKPTP